MTAHQVLLAKASRCVITRSGVLDAPCRPSTMQELTASGQELGDIAATMLERVAAFRLRESQQSSDGRPTRKKAINKEEMAEA